MNGNRKMTLVAGAILIFGTLLSNGGCPEGGVLVPFNVVRVVLINDTDFAVDPDIRFDDDSNWLAGIWPSETLSTGLLQAGESATYNFDCDELGLIVSREAEQILDFFGTYAADATRTLKRDDDYDCGDIIRFRFVGEGVDFGVIVSVNGRVVN